jgi:hypothetical protein
LPGPILDVNPPHLNTRQRRADDGVWEDRRHVNTRCVAFGRVMPPNAPAIRAHDIRLPVSRGNDWELAPPHAVVSPSPLASRRYGHQSRATTALLCVVRPTLL